MNNTTRNSWVAVVNCLIILLMLCGCGPELEREYYDDLHIQLEAQQAEIIIKEWQFLTGSGAEVYYKEDDKEILLGKLLGGNDGFCPFKEGMYSVAVDDSELTIEWCRFPNDKEIPWEKKTFELPSN